MNLDPNNRALWGAAIGFLACTSDTEHSYPTSPIADALSPDEIATTDGIVGDARVVTFGEVAHRLDEAHNFGVALFQYLVEEHQFRVLFLESSWYLADRLENFMTNEDLEVSPDVGFYLNAFQSPQVAGLLRYVKEHNLLHPDDRIHLAGMHPENPVSDARAIIDFFDSSVKPPDETMRNALEPIRTITKDATDDLDFIIKTATRDPVDPLDDQKQAALDHAISELKSYVNSPRDDRDLLRLRLSITSLETYLQYLVPFARAFKDGSGADEIEVLRRSVYEKGDEARSTIVLQSLSTKYTGLRAMTWVHDWHAAKRSQLMGAEHAAVPPLGTISFGARMDRALGDSHVVIGSLASVEQSDSSSNDLAVAFLTLLGDRRTMIDVARVPSALAYLPIAEPGDLLVEPTLNIKFSNVVLAQQFDGVVFFPTWTPITN